MTLAIGVEEIGTDRITLRRINQSDLEYFTRIHWDPEVAKYIGAGNQRPRAETERWLADCPSSEHSAILAA